MRDTIAVIDKKVNLYKRGRSSYWQAAIKLKSGKWERFSTGTDNEAEARDKALKLYYGAEAKAENKLPQSTRKFRNVAKYAIQRMQTELDGGGGKVVYKDYIRVIDNYLIPFFGKYDIANVDVKLLREYADWRDNKMGALIEARRLNAIKNRSSSLAKFTQAVQVPAKPFKAKVSTINTHNSSLNRVLDEAMLFGWITDSIRPTVLNKGAKGESRGAFTQKEYNFILYNLAKWKNTGHRKVTRELREILSSYVGFLAGTGVRHGTEAYNLKWRNIREVEDGNEPPYIAINVDGKRGKRELIATDETSTFLLMLHELNPNVKHLDYEEMRDTGVDEYVFVNRSGERVTTDALSGAFKIFLEKHNLRKGADNRNRTLYSLRHTYATKALMNGRNIHLLAVQMGTSVAMLEKFYSKISAVMNASEHAGRNILNNK